MDEKIAAVLTEILSNPIYKNYDNLSIVIQMLFQESLRNFSCSPLVNSINIFIPCFKII